MLRLDLEVHPRDLGQRDQKKNVNQLRREGWIPAVVYGHGDPSAVVVNEKILNKAIHSKAGTSAIFNLKLGGQVAMSVIKEIQRDIFTQKPVHVDFQRIDAKEKIEVTIPVHLLGESNGVKNQGGILEHIQRELRIKCLPDDLVPSIDVDVSNLNIHQSIKVSELPALKGVEVLTPGDHIVVNIVAQKVEEEKPAVVAEGAVQPEVITKGKKDEEGAPAAGAATPPAPAEKAEKGEKAEKKK